MKKEIVLTGGKKASEIVAGCMRINALAQKEIDAFVLGAVESGVNFFDHADIYGGGECERLFGKTLAANKGVRESIIVQSKCGIISGKSYNFSYRHITESAEGSLKRLQTDYLDILLLHRPDALVEPEEVAKAFDELQASGKVRHFGVSNQNPYQIELLKTAVYRPLEFNQMQLSAAFTGMIDGGLNVNNHIDAAISRDGHILEYCRLKGITLQAWSPFQYGFFEGVFIGSPKYKKLNAVLDRLAQKYQATPSAIAAAFILRIPHSMQVIAGTTKLHRLQEISKAPAINLDHAEWYEIYLAAGNTLP